MGNGKGGAGEGCGAAFEPGNGRGLRHAQDGVTGEAGQGWPPRRWKWRGTGPDPCLARGWGPAPLLPDTPISANSRTTGVPGAHTPQPWPFLGCGCAPFPRPSPGNALGAHCSLWLRRLSHRLGTPIGAAPSWGWGLPPGGPSPPRAPAAAARSERTGPGRDPACLSQTRVRARQALSPRPRLSFPDQKMGPGRADGVRPPGTPSPGRALTTPRLRSSARGAGAAQLPRAASASSSSGSGGTRARGRGGPGIALTGRAARRGRPRAARAQRAAPGRLSRPAAGRGGAC